MDKLAAKYQVSTALACQAIGMSESTYYYRPKQGKRGLPVSESTLFQGKEKVDNQQIVSVITDVLEQPFHDYWGYHNLTAELRARGYQINHKKVYRLMKDARLLKPSTRLRQRESGRKYVQFRKVATQQPFDCLEIDIKCVWIAERGKNAYLMSLLDVHTRKIIGHVFNWQMKKEQVMGLLSSLVDSQKLMQGAIIDIIIKN